MFIRRKQFFILMFLAFGISWNIINVSADSVTPNPTNPSRPSTLDTSGSNTTTLNKTPCEVWSQSLPKGSQENRVCTDLYEGLPVAVLEKPEDCVKEGIGLRDPKTGKIGPASSENEAMCYALLTGSGIGGFQAFIAMIYRFASIAIGIIGVLMIIVAGIQISIGGASPDQVASGKKRIVQIIAGIVLFYLIGAILRLLNPSFFT